MNHDPSKYFTPVLGGYSVTYRGVGDIPTTATVDMRRFTDAGAGATGATGVAPISPVSSVLNNPGNG